MSVTENLRALAAAQKTPRGVPAYTLYVNRRLGRLLAAVAHDLRCTPDQVTAVSGLLTLAALAVVVTVPPSAAVGVSVSLLLVLAYALDSADGQLARLRGGGGPAGEWFDHVVDAAKAVALHGAVLVAAYRFLDVEPAVLLLPLAFQVVGVVTFSSTLLTDLLRRAAPALAASAAPDSRASGSGPGGALRSLAKLPVDFGVLCLVMALFGSGRLFWYAYALLLVAATGYLLVHLVHARRTLAALVPARPAPSREVAG